MTFAVGDRVEWTSQANGGRRTKRGTVLCVVPAGIFAATVLQKLILRDAYNEAHPDGGYKTRPHVSYIIRVEAPAPSRARPQLYWPRVALMKKSDDA